MKKYAVTLRTTKNTEYFNATTHERKDGWIQFSDDTGKIVAEYSESDVISIRSEPLV